MASHSSSDDEHEYKIIGDGGRVCDVAVDKNTVPSPSNETRYKVKKVARKCRRKPSLLQHTLAKSAMGALSNRLEITKNRPTVEGMTSPVKVADVMDTPDVTVANVTAEIYEEDTVKVDLNAAVPPTTADGHDNLAIVVRSESPGDVGIQYTIGVNQTFEDFYVDYARKLDVTADAIRLFKVTDSILVKPTETPQRLSLKTSAVLFVLPMPGVINVDTRIKKFYVTNGARDPLTLTVSATLNTYLNRLFHVWSAAAHVDANKVVLIHEGKYVTTLQTVEEADIRNGDKLFAFVNAV